MKVKRKVLITGGSRGIGLEINRLFRHNAYDVLAPSRQELDLNDVSSITSYLASPTHRDVDILINNAGINIPEWIDEMNEETISETMQVNLISPFYLVRSSVSYMKKQKWGRIINTSSVFGIIARGKQSLYTATKHGINGLTKSLALELAPYNILVNSICPGFTKTELVLRNPPEKIKALEHDIPLGRLAEPKEIAQTVLFLASEENTYITGHTLVVDGGFSCK